MNREIIPILQCTSQPGAAWCLVHLVPLLFRHAQIFSNNHSKTVLFPIHLICNHLSNQSIIATHHLLYLLDIELCPAYWKPPTLGVLFHFLTSLFGPLVPLKHVYMTWCYLHTLADVFQMLVTEFFPAEPKISHLYIAQCSE